MAGKKRQKKKPDKVAVRKTSSVKPTPAVGRSYLYLRIRSILEAARMRIARSVDSNLVISNWLVGREIVLALQRGAARAAYGKGLIEKHRKNFQKNSVRAILCRIFGI